MTQKGSILEKIKMCNVYRKMTNIVCHENIK